MAVAHAQRPGREHQHRRHREDPAHRGDRQLVAIDPRLPERDELPVAQEAGCEQADDRPREEHAERGHSPRGGDEQREDRAGETSSLLALARGEQPRIDRNERRR